MDGEAPFRPTSEIPLRTIIITSGQAGGQSQVYTLGRRPVTEATKRTEIGPRVNEQKGALLPVEQGRLSYRCRVEGQRITVTLGREDFPKSSPGRRCRLFATWLAGVGKSSGWARSQRYVSWVTSKQS